MHEFIVTACTVYQGSKIYYYCGSMQHDILIKKLLLTHDPDGCRLDSETMLHAVGNIFCYMLPQ